MVSKVALGLICTVYDTAPVAADHTRVGVTVLAMLPLDGEDGIGAEGGRGAGAEIAARVACSLTKLVACEVSDVVLISIAAFATSLLSALFRSCVISVAVVCSRLTATASAFEAAVALAVKDLAADS
jgi:hypothetical protein